MKAASAAPRVTPIHDRHAIGIKAATKYVDLHENTLRNLIRKGRLSDVKIERRRLILVDELHELCEGAR